MSERNQEENLVTTWANAQQKVLAGWLDLMQGTERPSHAVTWNETMKAWQTAVQETLDAQARWLRDWTGRVQVTSGSPTDLRKSVQPTSQYFFPVFPNSSDQADQFPSMWRSFRSRPPTNMAFARWARPSILHVLPSIMPGRLSPSSILTCPGSMVMASCMFPG